ncbi:MAG: hypothetical protein ACJ73E_00900, partial [Mycobacteriales bacterium]
AALVAAVVAVLVAAVLVAATGWGRPGVVVAVAALQALLVPAWVVGAALPGRIGGTLLGLGAAAAADAALLVRDRVSVMVLLGVLGLALPAMLLHQLARGVVRVRVTESLAGIAVLLVAVVALSALIALARAVDGSRLVAALVVGAGAGLAVARLVDAVAPAPRLAEDVGHGLLGVFAAGVAGAAGGALVAGEAHQLSGPGGALLGAVVAVLAALVAVGVGYVTATGPAPRRGRRVALAYLGVVLPLALAAPAGYLVSLAVAG